MFPEEVDLLLDEDFLLLGGECEFEVGLRRLMLVQGSWRMVRTTFCSSSLLLYVSSEQELRQLVALMVAVLRSPANTLARVHKC